MTESKNILSSGWAMVVRNGRYIFWFWLLNLTLAEFGASGFRKTLHSILDHRLFGDRLVRGFDVPVLLELFSRPEFGQFAAMSTPALYFAFLFFMATALFLPGVFAGYASTYRLPRAEFFRACGRNLWRFIRLLLIAGIVMGIVAGLLFTLHNVIVEKAGESTNERLPFELQVSGLALIFLIMTTMRIWFDLAEADIVLSDQRAVRKSIALGLRHTLRSLVRLLASYFVITIVAAAILVAGLLAWMKFVAPQSIMGAFLAGQVTLFLLLLPRFWQRGVAVAYWRQKMLVPVAEVPLIVPQPLPDPPAPIAPAAPAAGEA